MRASQALYWMAIVCMSYVAPVLAADTPTPAVTILMMIDGSVELEGEQYSEPDSLRAKLAEIGHRIPKPELQVRFGNGPCGGDPFKEAYELLAKAGFVEPGVIIISRLCGGRGPLRPVPVQPLLPSNQDTTN